MTQCPLTVKVVSRTEIYFLLSMTFLHLQIALQLIKSDFIIEK